MLLLRAHRLLRYGSLSVASSQEEVRFWGAAPFMVALYFGSILRLCACTSVMRTYVPCVIFFQHTPVDLTLRQAPNTLHHCELFIKTLAILMVFAIILSASGTIGEWYCWLDTDLGYRCCKCYLESVVLLDVTTTGSQALTFR